MTYNIFSFNLTHKLTNMEGIFLSDDEENSPKPRLPLFSRNLAEPSKIAKKPAEPVDLMPVRHSLSPVRSHLPPSPPRNMAAFSPLLSAAGGSSPLNNKVKVPVVKPSLDDVKDDSLVSLTNKHGKGKYWFESGCPTPDPRSSSL